MIKKSDLRIAIRYIKLIQYKKYHSTMFKQLQKKKLIYFILC